MFFTVSRTQIKYIKLSNLKLKFIFLKEQTSRNMIIKYNAIKLNQKTTIKVFIQVLLHFAHRCIAQALLITLFYCDIL